MTSTPALALLALFFAASFLTPSWAPADSDPVAEATAVISQNYDRDIRPLFNRTCVACHDSHARPEGFLGRIPGIRAREWNHIRLASKVMDLSRPFPNWSAQNSSPVFFLDQIRAVIQQNRMPTWDFRLAHHLDHRLLNWREKQKVIQWTLDSEQLLNQADASRPTAVKLFQNRCLGCHNPTTHAAALVFEVTAANELKIPDGATDDGIPYLTPGSPENSAIFLVLSNDASTRKGLPRMPKNADAFSDQDRDLVYDWIKKQQ